MLQYTTLTSVVLLLATTINAGRPRKRLKRKPNEQPITNYFQPVVRRLSQQHTPPVDTTEEQIDDLFDNEVELPNWAEKLKIACLKQLNRKLHQEFITEFCLHVADESVTDKNSLLASTSNNTSLLHWTAQHDAWLVAKVLLTNGANLGLTCKNKTPLYCAVNNNHRDFCVILLQHGAQVSSSFRHKNELHLALKKPSKEICQLLLSNTTDMTPVTSHKETYTHLAAKRGDPELLQIVIDKGAVINARTDRGVHALHYAASSTSAECVRMLIKAKAELDAADDSGNTALHYAVIKKAYKVASALLDAGADPTMQNDNGQTPLHLACVCQDVFFVNYITLHAISYPTRFVRGEYFKKRDIMRMHDTQVLQKKYDDLQERFVRLLSAEDSWQRTAYSYFDEVLIRPDLAKTTLNNYAHKITDPFALAQKLGNRQLSQQTLSQQEDGRVTIKITD